LSEIMPTSMAEAKSSGALHYFTGKPCRNGHVEKRYASGGCMGCLREIARKQYAKNPEYTKSWQRENRDRASANAAAWKARNPERVKVLQAEFKRRFPKKQTHDAALARARRLNAVPSWVDLKAIRAIYDACPPGLEVDHIVPLKHEQACGLHVPWNLQYLTKAENSAKNKRANLEELNYGT
jgi:5-methylcytosine-specific restriction endonuclease McrA